MDRRGVFVSSEDPPQRADPSAWLAYKTPVALATTENITLIGLQSIDGTVTADRARVLVKDQDDLKLNGIYLASPGNWQRAPDAKQNSELAPGAQVYVLGGTAHGGKIFVLTTSDPLVLGTSLLVWTERLLPLLALEFNIDGGGALVTAGAKYSLEVPFACTIIRATLLADATGDAIVDVYRVPYSGFPSSASNSICGDALATLSSARRSQDRALDGWSRALSQGDLLTAYVNSVSGIGMLTLSLVVSRS